MHMNRRIAADRVQNFASRRQSSLLPSRLLKAVLAEARFVLCLLGAGTVRFQFRKNKKAIFFKSVRKRQRENNNEKRVDVPERSRVFCEL